MPELPEVETIANGVDRRVRGDAIVATSFSKYKEPFKTPPTELAAALTGMRISRVYRVGKHIVADLTKVANQRPRSRPSRREPNSSANSQLIVHLGMTGRLLVSPPGRPAPAAHPRRSKSQLRP